MLLTSNSSLWSEWKDNLLDSCCSWTLVLVMVILLCRLVVGVSWSQQKEEMAWCLKQPCVSTPPAQQRRCLNFTGVSPCPVNIHQMTVGRHPPDYLRPRHNQTPSCLTGSTKQILLCPFLCRMSSDRVVGQQGLAPSGHNVRQKPGVKLRVGKCGSHHTDAPCLHVWPNALMWKSQEWCLATEGAECPWRGRMSLCLWLNWKLPFAHVTSSFTG